MIAARSGPSPLESCCSDALTALKEPRWLARIVEISARDGSCAKDADEMTSITMTVVSDPTEMCRSAP
jgi:hypothetical protein